MWRNELLKVWHADSGYLVCEWTHLRFPHVSSTCDTPRFGRSLNAVLISSASSLPPVSRVTSLPLCPSRNLILKDYVSLFCVIKLPSPCWEAVWAVTFPSSGLKHSGSRLLLRITVLWPHVPPLSSWLVCICWHMLSYNFFQLKAHYYFLQEKPGCRLALDLLPSSY